VGEHGPQFRIDRLGDWTDQRAPVGQRPVHGGLGANAADWLGKLGAAVHIAHGAGHYMTTNPGPVLDTIRHLNLS
jgi:hypothetical protein